VTGLNSFSLLHHHHRRRHGETSITTSQGSPVHTAMASCLILCPSLTAGPL
jgi:hypothetical protein